MNFYKQEKTLMDADIRIVVVREKQGWGEDKKIKEVKYMMKEGNKTLGGEHKK